MQCSQCDPSIHWVLKCGSDIRRIPSSSNNSSIIVIRILPLIDIASGLLSSPVWVPHQHRKVYISKTGPTKSPSVVGNLQKTPKILASQIPAFCGLLALNQSWSESPTELGGGLLDLLLRETSCHVVRTHKQPCGEAHVGELRPPASIQHCLVGRLSESP